ncbi:aquaporin-3-like [Limanda limanda]|uniref:aquaporin-3-like n=1 Tax=Limanda limanda TaxID=27771 RepID=UPI0029C7E0B9|nr:aquaporin-3-like [Limanda limanda]
MKGENKRKLREMCRLRMDILREFLVECLGTFVLVLFGCGSVAQVVLSRGALGGALTIHIGFAVGVTMGIYMAASVSGGHVNPAVTLAMVILGKLPLKKLPVYMVAQFLGAFIGACGVYVLYYDALMDFSSGQLLVTGPNATANIFSTYPAQHLFHLNGFVDQVFSAGILVLCILVITDKYTRVPEGLQPLLIGWVIMGIGVAMGLNCGYALNPARDFGPRVFTAVAGWGSDVFRAERGWWWIPLFGPLVGGAVAACIYCLCIKFHRPKPEIEEENNIQDKYGMITMS